MERQRLIDFGKFILTEGYLLKLSTVEDLADEFLSINQPNGGDWVVSENEKQKKSCKHCNAPMNDDGEFCTYSCGIAYACVAR